MLDRNQFAALLGFLFAAVWAIAGLGDAVLCLLGAAAFTAIAAYMRGELDLGEVGDRLQGSQRR
ncbi:hypothetical protein HJD18_01965 [Thermoleophilia bacterium SCSIO 60948]|nr:hypothetical protein HJD18_01965 [Thermoleophilia bacterium SCSIO 60948]